MSRVTVINPPVPQTEVHLKLTKREALLIAALLGQTTGGFSGSLFSDLRDAFVELLGEDEYEAAAAALNTTDPINSDHTPEV